MNTVYYGKELYHFGTKGQKWGVRNYQNPDGSYTAKGEGRYNSDSSSKPSLRSKIGSTAKKVAKTALIGAGAAGLAYVGGKAAIKGLKYAGAKAIEKKVPQQLAKQFLMNKLKNKVSNNKLVKTATAIQDKFRKKSYTEQFIGEITSQLGTFADLYSKSDTPEKMAKAKAEVEDLVNTFRNMKL